MEKYFAIDFWKQFLSIFTHWLITDLISIFIIILLLIISLRIASALVVKLRVILLKRMAYRNEEPDLEIEKRLNTLMGIVRKVTRVIIWSIFGMIFLEKITV